MAVECAACVELLRKYETATFEQAKIHSALNIANHLRDRAAARRLTLEAFEVTTRQREARAALQAHRDSAHHASSVLA
jgi:hypothetical protein